MWIWRPFSAPGLYENVVFERERRIVVDAGDRAGNEESVGMRVQSRKCNNVLELIEKPLGGK